MTYAEEYFNKMYNYLIHEKNLSRELSYDICHLFLEKNNVTSSEYDRGYEDGYVDGKDEGYVEGYEDGKDEN